MDEHYIQIGEQTFLRSWARARVFRADEKDALPLSIQRATAEVEKKFHWQDGKNPDLVHVKFILDTEGANNNWDYMPREQLLTGHATAVYKPLDMSHVIKENASMVFMSKDNPPVRNTIYGVITATAPAWASSGELLTDQEITDLDRSDDWNRPDKDKVAVVAWGALYSFLFPKTVADITDAIDNGEMFVSMERWIGQHDYLVFDQAKSAYEPVSREEATDLGHVERWKNHQKVNGQPLYRRSLSYVYGGAATTDNPANKMARFVEPNFVKAAASMQDTALPSELEKLLESHGECHRAFAISTGEDRAAVIERHRKITSAIAAYLGK